MHSDARAAAQWMVERVHEAGKISRRQLNEEVLSRFPDIELGDRAISRLFRKLGLGSIRYEAAGQLWVSLTAVSPTSPRLLRSRRSDAELPQNAPAPDDGDNLGVA